MFTTQPLELTREETYALESVLRNDDEDEGVKVARPLLLKVGSAFLQQQSEGQGDTRIALEVTERETWLARDRIPLTLQIGQQPVGLTLKQKLYTILLAFDTQASMGDELSGLAAYRLPKVQVMTRRQAQKRLRAAHRTAAYEQQHRA